MSILTTNLVEVIQWGAEIAGVLDLPTRHWPQPGQYLPCQHVQGGLELLPANLFRVLGGPDQLTVGPMPAFWQPGDPLVCAPPQGRGFNLPKYARRVGLVPYSVSPARLLALAHAAFDQNASVALFYDVKPHDDILERMPSQVEVLPLSSLQENLDWADYLAIDLERSALDRFCELINWEDVPITGEVLVRTAMPCRGVGDCGVCAVKTRRGWRLACVDGPVFPIAEVLHVAR